MEIQDGQNEKLIKKQKIYSRIKLITIIICNMASIASSILVIISEFTAIPKNVHTTIAFTLCGIFFLNLIPLIVSTIVLAKISPKTDNDEEEIKEDIEENDQV